MNSPLYQPPATDTPLTDEQRAIVAHDYGPALVFAVAGAGKTTAMTYRIERLVREGVFPARALLATSFSKASVRDIKQALGRWQHCASVPVQTLHAVGWGLLRLAQRRGHLPELALSSEDEGGAESQLLGRVLGRAWREKVSYAPELEELDRQDFLTYVGVMKANLWYADLDKAKLPPAAFAVAGQAPAPPGFPWYRALYGLYEQVRTAENILTFDDMLLSGWECLHRFPDVLDEARRRFQCVLVDEFQDVNRVQSEMLDLLTAPDRHYMAIGDDDQTIYEWRGADPSLILSFARRYGAKRYFIHDNFRSHAAPLALANRVIEKNQKREPKRLSLTRGFAGKVTVHDEDSPEGQGRHVAKLVGEALKAGHRPDEIALLVRLYAQTPYLEQALLEAEIPYRVVGSSPFYSRPEVLTLLDYLRLAEREGPLPPQHGGTEEEPIPANQFATLSTGAPEGPSEGRDRTGTNVNRPGLGLPAPQDWETRWYRIANKPVRYLSRVACDSITQAVRQGATLTQALTAAAQSASDHLAARILDLAETLTWLSGALHTLPAGAVLTLLDQKLGYTDYLRRSSGFPETGAARASNVDAFLRYAHGAATPAALLAHLDDLAQRGIGQNRTDAADTVSLLTVFRAKGLQWPVVFVPDCNQGIFPYGGPDEIEEERRLFYVALTRTQAVLHLHVVKTEPPSQFLTEADWRNTLSAVGQVETLLTRDPAAWHTAEALALVRHAPALGLTRFFQTWWHVPTPQAHAIAARLLALLDAAQRQNLTLSLGLTEAHRAPWASFGPFAEIVDDEAFADLADFAPPPTVPLPAPERIAFRPGGVHVGGQVQHPQHGVGTILAVRGDRLSPRLEIQFGRGKPVVLPAKFVELVGA